MRATTHVAQDEARPADKLAAHAELVAGLKAHLRTLHAGQRVQVVQTHASSLLLVADQVYKLKKPVQLPFMDFSTLALRQQACTEELRLNARTAPDLYLKVMAVRGTRHQPQLAGRGPVLDWAVVMRRFAAGNLLLDRVHKGTVDHHTIDRLAQRVADFHAALPAAPARLGTVAQTMALIRSNVDELASLAAGTALQAGVQRLQEWTMATLAREQAHLQRRRRQGFVRECHGDLHLGNVALIGGEPLLFDALEFNPRLRHIDTVCDLAFLWMDLQAHGLPSLAWRLVGAWADQTGDHAGLTLLQLYGVYLACVRAKVALLRRAQLHGSARTKALAEARRYVRLALQLMQARSHQPQLVLTRGLSGSGKTTVSQHLLERMGAVRLRSDVERKRLHGMTPLQRPQPDIAHYSAAATRRTFALLARRAGVLLDGGLDVIVDAAFLRRPERERMVAVAAQRGLRCTVVECTAPLPVLWQRVARRARQAHDASDATLDVLQQQLRWADAHESEASKPPPARWIAKAVRPRHGSAQEGTRTIVVNTDLSPRALRQRCQGVARRLT